MKHLLALAALVVATAIAAQAGPAPAAIDYHISLANPDAHLFHVRMTIPDAAADTHVAIPAWNALYQVRDFSYRVRDVRTRATNASDASWNTPKKLDKQTWTLGPAAAPSADVTYTIEWNDAGPFNSQLDEHHAFVNFAEVLMYVPDRRADSVTVEFDDVPAQWHATAELPAGAAPNSYTAPSYDQLVDAPVEIGKSPQFTWNEGPTHFRVVLDAGSTHEVRKDLLEDYLKRITRSEIEMMGGAPFPSYTFFLRIGPYPEVGGGGMEHANCTAIAASSVEGIAATAAHEFFHAWNVKRIRPQALEPVNFTQENYTRALWFAEGVTSTYGAYTLERIGVWDSKQFYADLSAQIHELQSRPAHTWQSVEESSLDAWLEKYDDYRRADRSISYYNKGQIVGEMLDLKIRAATDDHKSLDDVLRALYAKYPAKGRFYDESAGIQAVAEEVSGTKLDDFFAQYVAGTKEIPYDEFLNAAGLTLEVEARPAADLGFIIVGRAPNAPQRIAYIVPDSAAEDAGLRVGDIVVQLNGEAPPRNLQIWAQKQQPGAKVTVRVHRDSTDSDSDITFVMGAANFKQYKVEELPNATDKQKRLRNAWLAGKTE
jgi:predicted metalloprotease with PDZ domain